MRLRMKLLSVLEKVFLDEEPAENLQELRLEGFENETVSFQAAFCLEGRDNAWIRPEIESPLKACIRVRQVRHVPVRFACMPDSDDNYLRRTPGLYPDLLREMRPHGLHVCPGQWNTLWLDMEPEGRVAPGTYPLKLNLLDEDSGDLLGTAETRVHIFPGMLPAQTLKCTRWFHYDSLAHVYDVPVFSEAFWRITENFMRTAVRRGVNMMLMPVHTPPLDTRVGGERLTVQLVDVYRNKGVYSFGFEKLRRWADMARRCGVEYFEVAHLFTQWGAGFTPKIMAEVDGEYRRIFGWDVPAGSGEYRAFLDSYLPALRGELRKLGMEEKCVFHISDEPGPQHLESYRKARAMVEKHLQGCVIMDALSDFHLWENGVVSHPVPALDHMDPFVAAGIPGLWTYYCVAQYRDVSNMFMAMPSARNRILGVQLFRYDLEGFLHWGYNFYGAQYSDYQVDPYEITDGDGFSPAGDCFQVYPARNGEPEESIRLMVTFHALQDLRALRWLEALSGREEVLRLVNDGLSEPLTFRNYPRDGKYLLDLRQKVNRAIAEKTQNG